MKRILVAITILAGAVSGAQAGLVLYDNFGYNGGNGGLVTNSSGAWFDNSGTVTADQMITTNSMLRVSSSGVQDTAHFLSGGTYYTNSAAVLYSRFTLMCSNTTTATTIPSAGGTYFAAFGGTNAFYVPASHQYMAGYRCRLCASATRSVDATPAPAGQFWLGVAPAVALATNGMWATTLNASNNYVIVTKYVVATGQSTLWVNPANEADTHVTDSTAIGNDAPPGGWPTNGVLNIAGYCFRQASGEGTMWISNLRVAPSWNDLDAPSIAPTPGTQSIPMNGATPALAFQVGSPNVPANSLTLSHASDYTTLVPNDDTHITFTRDAGGTNCTVTVTPATGVQGQANITLTVTDSSVPVSSSISFLVQVGAPTISAIPNLITPVHTATNAQFVVNDTEGDPLTIYKASGNTTLVTAGDIVVTGSGANRTVTVTPEPSQNGVAWITLSVSDGYNTNSSTFGLTVPPAAIGLVYSEDFAYSDFTYTVPNALNGANGGSGGPWNHISGVADQVQVTNYPPNGGIAYLGDTNTEAVGADFIGPTAYDGSQGYVFYTAFTVNFSLAPSAAGGYFFHLSASGTDTSAFHDKVWASKAGAAPGRFRLGIGNFSGSEVAQNTRDLTTNVNYEVVTRHNAGTGDSTLWINPVTTATPSVTASDSPGSATIGGVGLREPSSGGFIGNIAIGPMKVGTALSDVFTPPASPPVLNYSVVGPNLVLSWNSPLYALLSTSDLSLPFAEVQGATPAPGASSPYTYSVPLTGPPQFFRLSY